MAIYTKPPRMERIPFPPPASHVSSFCRLHRLRYVSKPLGQDVCPNEIFLGWSKITRVGSNGTSNYIWSQSAEHGLLAGRVNPYSGNYGRSLTGMNLIAQASNKCYDRFKDKVLGSNAELGVNLAERHQAVRMITDRANTLRKAYSALRQGKLRVFYRSLNVKPLPKHQRWTYARNASAFWLEYHFGWSPLIGDIYNACDVLQAGYGKPRPIRARGSASDYIGLWKNFGAYQDVRNTSMRCDVQTGARVLITNPNLHQAARLGLINPISVAWELIPFSFLVDWFIPVGKFLNSWSDFVGLSFKNPYSTVLMTATGSIDYQWSFGSGQYGISNDIRAISAKRTQGLISPVVYPKQFKGLSVTRAATAVSLLLQVFKPGSRG